MAPASLHGSTPLSLHGSTPLSLHGLTPASPHGSTPASPHRSTPLNLHGLTLASPHGSTPASPHGSTPLSLHGSTPASPHRSTPLSLFVGTGRRRSVGTGWSQSMVFSHSYIPESIRGDLRGVDSWRFGTLLSVYTGDCGTTWPGIAKCYTTFLSITLHC